MLLDDRCSDGFRADMEVLAEDIFTPVWSHAEFRRDSFAEPVAAATDRPGGSAPYLITTRIDSDDAMAVDYLASVQAQFARQERLFVNFTRGVQIDRSGAVYLSHTLSNPFISLIERREAGRLPDTVYVAKHARARAHGPIREVRAPVMWAQVVHDLNVSNIVNAPRTSPRVVADRFQMELGYDADISGRGPARGSPAPARTAGTVVGRSPGRADQGGRGERLATAWHARAGSGRRHHAHRPGPAAARDWRVRWQRSAGRRG